MELSRLQLGGIFVIVVIACAAAGSISAWLVNARQSTPGSSFAAATTQPTTQPGTQPTSRPALMARGENITLTGKAICGTCFLDLGPYSQHFVVLEIKDPYRTFLLAENDKLDEIEAITGTCANGDYELTVTGDVLTVNGQNVLVVHSFTHQPINGEGS